MNNVAYGKAMENLKNRIDVKLVGKKIVSQKIFNNDLVAIRKSKVTLTLNKPAYT